MKRLKQGALGIEINVEYNPKIEKWEATRSLSELKHFDTEEEAIKWQGDLTNFNEKLKNIENKAEKEKNENFDDLEDSLEDSSLDKTDITEKTPDEDFLKSLNLEDLSLDKDQKEDENLQKTDQKEDEDSQKINEEENLDLKEIKNEEGEEEEENLNQSEKKFLNPQKNLNNEDLIPQDLNMENNLKNNIEDLNIEHPTIKRLKQWSYYHRSLPSTLNYIEKERSKKLKDIIENYDKFEDLLNEFYNPDLQIRKLIVEKIINEHFNKCLKYLELRPDLRWEVVNLLNLKKDNEKMNIIKKYLKDYRSQLQLEEIESKKYL